ncbi:MAG TPA: DUF2807 domain-containing protein [Candidatus Babeliales bacterium]|jgi:hypothetical protein|nr:DUF2807 domain-containing protein [Candidatus Babeliales bacterium]
MNTYIAKIALVASLGIVPAMTNTGGFSWNNGRYNIQMGANNRYTRCDENGCTVFYTDENGVSHSKFENCKIGTIIRQNGQTIVLNGNILNSKAIYNADGIAMYNNIVVPVKAGDTITIQNDTIRKNDKKIKDVIALSGKEIEVPTNTLKVNHIDVPHYLAEVYVGDKSGISCDEAIASLATFQVKNGKLDAKLDKAYKYEGKSPCKVLVQMLGSALKVDGSSHVTIDQQPINKLNASGAVRIQGSLISNNEPLKVNASGQSNISINNNGEARRELVNLSLDGQSNITMLTLRNKCKSDII